MKGNTILASVIAVMLSGTAWAAGTEERVEGGAESASGTGTAAGGQVGGETPMVSGSYRLRASDVLGMDVQNGQQEEIGEVDDLIITEDNTVVHAVVSVGGFLGMGDKLVTVPYSELQLPADKSAYVVYNATKEQLEAKPEFEYKQGELTGREYRDEAMKRNATQ